MQKKNPNKNKLIKQTIIITIIALLLLLLIFAEDIIKQTNKNKLNLAENTEPQITGDEPNPPTTSAGIIPIKWDGENWVITTKTDWYDYKNGKPAYMMLNDGTYQSELQVDMTNKKLAEENIGKKIQPSELGTIFVWIPSFAINENGSDIKYIKDIQTPEEGWTKPEIFTYKQANETYPDFLLTGIWFEIDVDTAYSNKINQMNQEESIYGFIRNTVAVPSDQETGNQIQQYMKWADEQCSPLQIEENTTGENIEENGISNNNQTTNTMQNVGATIGRPEITAPTNPNRIILKIVNTKNQNPIKAKASYNKDTGLIEVQVTYTQYGINKILYENTQELKLTKNGKQATATSEGINVQYGTAKITIIDNQGNTKELELAITSKVFVTLYTDGTLGFCSNTSKIAGKTVRQDYGDISDKEYGVRNYAPWYVAKNSPVKTVEFVDKIAPKSTAEWFYFCSNLTTINNIENLNTSNVTNMDCMFAYCSSLTSLDLSSFDTRNVVRMWSVFGNCTTLSNLDISNFDTSSVTYMQSIFSCCSSLTSLDLSGWDTSNVTDMGNIFGSCSNLTSLDISNFDTSNVTNMASMFYGCTSLTSLDLSSFDTSNVTDISGMLGSCSSLSSLDVSSFNTSKVTNTTNMFSNCSSLTQITFGENWSKEITLPTLTKPCSGWYSDADFTNKVAEAGANYTPAGPITIYANVPPDIYVKLYTDGTLAFCSNNSQIPFKTLEQDYGNIAGKEYSSTTPWYNQRTSITTVNIIDEVAPISTATWFYNCTNLATINDISNLNTSNVTTMTDMFDGCSSLTTLDLSNFNTSNVNFMGSMFSNCSSLTSLDLSNFDTNKVPSMTCMFYGCSSLTNLDLSSFDTSNVTNIDNIFYNCSSLTQITFGENWNKSVTLPTPTKEGYNCTGWYSDADFTNKVAEAGANYTPTEPITIYANLVPLTYATLYTDGTLAFGNTENPLPDKTISIKYGEVPAEGYLQGVSSIPWYTNRTAIKTVNFVDEIHITSANRLFYGCQNLAKVENMNNLKGVTNMIYMFHGCKELTSLDISNFDTSQVTDMYFMFGRCSSLINIDLSNFNTSNVTDMGAMFLGCSSLTSLDVSNFNTSNVTNMNSMFYGCSGLISLDVGNFNTSNVTDMSDMFRDCSKLQTIYVGENWTTDNATTTNMFTGCGTSTVTRK